MTKKKAAATIEDILAEDKPRLHHLSVCTPEEMADALWRAHGIARIAAQILDCTRRTVISYVKRFPEVDKAYREAREENVDVAENEQLKALKKGERWAVENWLFCSKEGRERGWLKRAEQAQDLSLLNAIQIVIPDNARDGGVATVDVTQDDGDGNVRQYTYAVTPEEARHQKMIASLVPGGSGLPRGNDSEWLNMDEWTEEETE